MNEVFKLQRWMLILTLGLMHLSLMAQTPGMEDVIDEEVIEEDVSEIYIKNHDFSSGTANWTLDKLRGAGNAQMCPSNSACVEYWTNAAVNDRAFDYHQELTGLEDGKYVLRSSMFYSGTDKSCGVYAMNAGFGEVFASCENLATPADRKEFQTPAFVVADGKLRIGLKNHTYMTGTWFGAEYIKLIKVGEATAKELATARDNISLTAKMPTTAEGRTGEYASTHDEERYAGDNSYFSTGKILYYRITGLDRGTYRVNFYAVANRARNIANQYFGDGIAQVFANNTAKDITVNNQASCVPTYYPYTLIAEVGVDGVLEYGIQNIKNGGQWYVVKNISLQKVNINSDCLKFTSPGNAKICMANVNDCTDHDFQYSIDGEIWYDYKYEDVNNTGGAAAIGTRPSATNNPSYIDISHNQKAYFRAKGRTGMLSEGNDLYEQNKSHAKYSRYSFYQNAENVDDIYASGNVMSLIDPYCQSLDVPKTCFSSLFVNMKSLVTAPRLPGTTLGAWCYEYMFYGCSKLKIGPDIPADYYSDGCMNGMFRGCTNLSYVNLSFTKVNNSTTGDAHSYATNTFNDRTSGVYCELWCYKSFYDKTSMSDRVNVHHKDASGNADWLCLTNIGSSDATVKLNSIGKDFGIQYSYDGSTWHSTIGGTRKVTKDVECDHCHGDGFTTANCGTCSGVGTVTPSCGACSGNKTISQTCSVCNGTGKKTCTAANCENGKVPCTHTEKNVQINLGGLVGNQREDAVCNGNGYLTWTYRGVINTYTRYFECPTCGPNKTKFNKNNAKTNLSDVPKGTGKVDCTTCSGTGKVSCPTTETVTCPDCGGSGNAAPVACGTCKGSKTKYSGCTTCGGSGEAYTKGGITRGTGTVRKEVDEPDPAASVEITLNTTTQSHVFFRTTVDHSDTEHSAFSASNYLHFVMTGRIAASGNVNSLLKADCNVTALPHHAFFHLFEDCTSLEQAPLLEPAGATTHITLGVSCYEGMFMGCSNLFASPELNAEDIKVDACYKQMFSGCKNLRIITTNFSEWDDREGHIQKISHFNEETGEETIELITLSNNATYQWVKDVYRDKECKFNNSKVEELIYDEHHIPCDEEVQWFAGDEDYLTFTAKGGAQWVRLVATGFTDDSKCAKLVYRTRANGSREWSAWAEYKFTLSGSNCNGDQKNLADGDAIQFRAGSIMKIEVGSGYNYYYPENNSKFSESTTKYYQFTFNTSGGNIEASGSISSLLSHDASNVAIPDYAFYKLFNGCTKLTTAPVLPGTILGRSCYNRMFYDCTGLVSTPELPALEMAPACYQYMFSGCIGLVITPKLNATKLSSACYAMMFQNCSALKIAPALPARDLAGSCYQSMFWGCGSLVEAPYLPTENLQASCYQTMFYSCSSLKNAPILRSTTLVSSCYQGMFQNCTSLVSAPELPATTLAKDCYNLMFSGCSSLKKIVVQFSNWTDASGNECTTSWVAGVSESGNFVCPEGLGTDEYGPNRVPKNSTHKWNVIKNPFIMFMAKTDDGAKVQLKRNGTFASTPQIQYSTSGSIDSWNDYNYNNEITLPEKGSIVLFRAKVTISDCGSCSGSGVDGAGNPCNTCKGSGKVETAWHTNSSFSQDNQNFFQFVTTGETELSGDVSSLVQGKYHKEWTIPGFNTDVPNSYAFYGLFKDNKAMTGKADVSFINLDGKTHCFQSMFENCEKLTSASPLPTPYNLTESCYEAMFKNCKSITEIPTMPTNANQKACFKEMFKGCTALKDGMPSAYSASAESALEGMFEGCTSLKSVPTLSSQWSVPTHCYKRMFAGCTGLKVGAPIMAETYNGTGVMESMYEGCTSLVSAPQFVNMQSYDSFCDSCCMNMFKGCTSLKTAPTLVTNLGKYCFAGMFENCTALQSAPLLSSKSLKNGCYKRMFAGCTALTSAPELPSESLVDACYMEMFKGCSNIRYIEVSFQSGWTAEDTKEEPSATYHWVEGVAPTGTFMCPSVMRNLKLFDYSHIPFGWRSEDNGDYFCFYGDGSTYVGITFSSPNNIVLQYSYDKDTWNEYSSQGIHLNNGQNGNAVYLKASNGKFNESESVLNSFYLGGVVSVKGNVMSLLDPSMQLTSVPDYAFNKLFQSCGANLKDASDLKLPATTVGAYAYANMFDGCTGIKSSATKAPELPATTLGEHCYENLFAGWTALTKAPELPATTLVDGCYNGIFNGCSELKEITVGFSTWKNGATDNWVNGVSNEVRNCRFVCPANLLSDAISPERWGSDNNYANIYGASKIPYDSDYRWVVILDVKMDFDYNTNKLTLSGGDNIHYLELASTADEPDADAVFEGLSYPGVPVDLSGWINEATDLTSRTYYAASSIAGLPSSLCQSIVRSKTVYAYPKYRGYCLAEDAVQLKNSLIYAEKTSSASHPVKIFVPNGTYNVAAKDVNMTIGDYVSLIGQSCSGTVIQTNAEDAAPVHISGNYAYLQDINFNNENASGYAFINDGMYTTLNVSMSSGNKYLDHNGTSHPEITPAWTTGMASGYYAPITKLMKNGGAINVITDADVILVEAGGGYDLTDSKVFYVNGALNKYTFRAANQYGGFGPYFSIDDNPLVVDVEPKDDAGNDLTEYNVFSDGSYVTLNDYGFASFYYEDDDVEIDGTLYKHRLKSIGASAFVAKCPERFGSVTLTHINEKDIIPSGTGVILFGTPGTKVHFYKDVTSDVKKYDKFLRAETNQLTGTLVDKKPGANANHYFGLSGKTFKRLSATGTLKAHKAFFYFDQPYVAPSPAASAASAMRNVRWGIWGPIDDEDSDSPVVSPEQTNLHYTAIANKISPTYNLLGQRTSKLKGLIVKNGKVVLVK